MEPGAVHNDHDHLSDHNDRSDDIDQYSLDDFRTRFDHDLVATLNSAEFHYIFGTDHVNTRFLYDGYYDGTDDEFVFFD